MSGADIDVQDNFGRAPLHVAAAVDYSEMVEFLITSGADKNIATLNEEQTPIHFAAKNGACRSLKMLLAYGADIITKDSQDRTPLQVYFGLRIFLVGRSVGRSAGRKMSNATWGSTLICRRVAFLG